MTAQRGSAGRSARGGGGWRGLSHPFRGTPLPSAMDERDPEEVPRDAHRQARSGAHAGPALVVPANWDDRDPEVPAAREIDELDIEDDAGHALATEEVLGGFPSETLEPALRILDRPDHPERCQQVKDFPEHAAVAR